MIFGFRILVGVEVGSFRSALVHVLRRLLQWELGSMLIGDPDGKETV
jgi:hypothetical protein